MIIQVPEEIKSEFEGYEYVIRLTNTLKEARNQDITFDFSLVNFLEANLCALIGAIFEILESQGNKINIVNMTRGVETILRKNGFLQVFGYTKIVDRYDTSLTYRKFMPNDDIGFSLYIQEQLLNKDGFPKHSDKLGKEIVKSIFEMYENARTHGKCEYIHTCGQFFPRKQDKPLHFTIVDKGINIKQNVSQYLKMDYDASEAIKWAMIKGNTTKIGNTSGGLGMSVIFDFITLNRGKIQVISSDGFYEYKNGVVETKKLNYVFDGTIVNIKFNLNDTNHYSLTSEIEDFENIF